MLRTKAWGISIMQAVKAGFTGSLILFTVVGSHSFTYISIFVVGIYTCYLPSSALRNFLLAKHVHHLLGLPSGLSLASNTRSTRRAPTSLRTWVR